MATADPMFTSKVSEASGPSEFRAWARGPMGDHLLGGHWVWVTTSCSRRPAPQSRAPHFPVSAPACMPSKWSSMGQPALPQSLDLSFVKTCTEPAYTHTHTSSEFEYIALHTCTCSHTRRHKHNAHRYLVHCTPACTRIHASHAHMQPLTRPCVNMCTHILEAPVSAHTHMSHTYPHTRAHTYTWMHEHTHVHITH